MPKNRNEYRSNNEIEIEIENESFEEKDPFEELNSKSRNKDAWNSKHRKDKDYRRKYENDDDGWN